MANRLLYISSYSLSLVVLLALIITVQESQQEDVRISKLVNVGSPKLKFFYCYSCGYRKMFEEYVSIISQKYPDLKIDGSNYAPPQFNYLLSRFIGVTKLFIILWILSGINIFMYIGYEQPGWWAWCVENKLYSCMMIFFLCNMIEVQLMSSGAFEITLNDVPVWSKLETGRIPQPNELFQIIDSHMQFSGGKVVETNAAFAK